MDNHLIIIRLNIRGGCPLLIMKNPIEKIKRSSIKNKKDKIYIEYNNHYTIIQYIKE